MQPCEAYCCREGGGLESLDFRLDTFFKASYEPSNLLCYRESASLAQQTLILPLILPYSPCVLQFCEVSKTIVELRWTIPSSNPSFKFSHNAPSVSLNN